MKGNLKPITLAILALVAAAFMYACSTKAARPREPRPELPEGSTMPYASPTPPERNTSDARSWGYGGLAQGAAPQAYAPLVAKSYRSGPVEDSVDASNAPAPPSRGGEELWVIVRAPDLEVEGGSSDEAATYPVLRAKPPGESDEIPLPLTHTDVRASIAGYIASVRVTQQYQNPYDSKIEAVYVFPLPQDAAVNEFLMTIGDRRIRGIIRERQEAERVYAEARQQGYVASLLTQERPNIFTQSVANIEPGKAIDVELVYFNPLAYSDGEYEFVFPMVVGPRFNPPGSGDGIGAVPRGQYGMSGQSTEIHYLAPNERSGHDIALSVAIDAGMPIERLTSPTHSIETEYVSANERRVTLSQLDTVPNRDFVLRYTLAGDTVKTALLTHRDDRGGFFTLMLQPPATLRAQARTPRRRRSAP